MYVTRYLRPKELNRLIDYYSKQGTLNQEAVQTFENLTHTIMIFFAVVSFLFYISEEPFAAGIFLILVPVGAMLALKELTIKQILPFAKGEKKKVKILRMKRHRHRTQTITCKSVDNPDEIIIISLGLKLPLNEKDYRPPNDVIEVFHQTGRKYAMPNLPHLKRLFSLDKFL